MIQLGIETSLMQSILDGSKTIEARLRTPKFVTLRVGDRLSFREDKWENDRIVSSTPNIAEGIVTQTRFFDTFTDTFNAVDYTQALPKAKSKTEAIDQHRRFYTSHQENEHGVVAIGFRLI